MFSGPGPAKGAGRVLHRARVDLDEQGTRAAAVTVVTARATGAGSTRPSPSTCGSTARSCGRSSTATQAHCCSWVASPIREHHLRREPDALPQPGPDPAEAPRPVPRPGGLLGQRGRAAARRGGARLRGLLRQRVDPLPPVVALPRQGRRRLHADRARGVGARHPRAPAHQHDGPGADGRQRARPAGAAVQRRRRDRHLHPGGRGGLLLPRRRGRRGHLRPRGRGRRGDDLRHAALPQARLRRDPARDDLPLPLRRPAALADLLHAGRDRDARSATATATASCSSTRRSPSATSARRPR